MFSMVTLWVAGVLAGPAAAQLSPQAHMVVKSVPDKTSALASITAG
jgi:hypothetical protein